MTSRIIVAILACLWLAATAAAPARAQTQAQRDLVIAWVSRADDPAYAEVKARDGVFRIVRRTPLPGAELGMRDAFAGTRAAGLSMRLERTTLAAGDDIGPALARLAGSGVAAAILDVPLPDFRAALGKAPGLLLVAVREIDDALRVDTCAAPVVHIQPSRLMRTDALAQFLVRRNWKKLLVLHGPEDEDRALAESMQVSAKKFGARVVAAKAFAVSNDPRRREETSVALLTGGADFDAVFIADSLGDAGRVMPYRIALPRPVIGLHGLDAVAWSPFHERNGAPQLNRRFEREAGRTMTDADWAAWVALRAIAEAEIREARQPTGAPLHRRILDQELRLELYKGVPGSFRPWDRQLRQGVLLATHNAVVELAPLDGFLHETNTLDTLGLLPNQMPCSTAAR